MHADQLKTLAIVEDHHLVRAGMELILAAREDIHVVYSGDDLVVVNALIPVPHVVLLDLDLHGSVPDLRLVSRLLASGSTVVVVSEVTNAAIMQSVISTGVESFVAKHDSPDAYNFAIDTVLGGNTWVSPSFAAIFSLLPRDPQISLSRQESKVLVMYTSGLKLTTIGRQLGISPHTVRSYLKRIRTKIKAAGFEADSRIDLYREALRRGLIEP